MEAGRTTTDWAGWHRRYDDPTSVQARRLVVVRRRVGEALDSLRLAAPSILSLCAGDGRDVIPELASRPGLRAEGVLVESNPGLADAARSAAAAAGLRGLVVRTADAALPESFADVLPVDLLLLCGIFGNVSEPDIRRTLAAAPAMVRPRGLVIWTRGRCGGDDLRPAVRRWVADVGLEEVAYDGGPELYGVGVARAADVGVSGRELPERLFTFFR